MEFILIVLVAATVAVGGTAYSFDPKDHRSDQDCATITEPVRRCTEQQGKPATQQAAPAFAASRGNAENEGSRPAPEPPFANSLPSTTDDKSKGREFTATLKGTLLHFTISAPIAFEVKQGPEDPEGLGVRITRDGDASAALRLNWRVEATGANPASAADFAADVLPNGTIVFEEGENSASLRLQAFADNLVEAVETFRIVFFDPETGLALETSDAQTAIVDAEIPLPLPGIGTDAPDLLIGTPDIDHLYGFAEDDILVGGFGDDYLNGGDGDDKLYGGSGSDELSGEVGSDIYEITFSAANRDRINDFGSSTDTDALILTGEVTVDLSFRQHGCDLVITNLVTLDEVRIMSQFSGDGVEHLAYTLNGSEVVLSRQQMGERADQLTDDQDSSDNSICEPRRPR